MGHVCCDCKKPIYVLEPSMMSDGGERWHLFCYHTRSDCEWLRIDENGKSVKLTPEEVQQHNEWARQTYPAPQ